MSGGKIIQIDNASGHYLPGGAGAKSSALDAFRRQGFNLLDDVYIEKAWNPFSKLWEAIGG